MIARIILPRVGNIQILSVLMGHWNKLLKTCWAREFIAFYKNKSLVITSACIDVPNLRH